MLSEDFDKKIREAADHHHPAYDERAWRDMRSLLDKHMPQDDRKRRWIFFLLLFLLLGTGIAGLVTGWWTGNGDPRKPVAVAKNQPGPSQPGPQTAPVETLSKNGEQDTNAPGDDLKTGPVSTASPATGTDIRNEPLPSEFSSAAARVQKRSHPRQTAEQKRTTSANHKKGSETGSQTSLSQPKQPVTSTAPPASTAQATKPVTKKETAATQVNQPPVAKVPVENAGPGQEKEQIQKEPAGQKEKKTDTGKKKKGGKSIFFLAASAGPDVSFTNGDAPGRMKMVGGFGLGYTYKDRLTLRTGFYSGRKVYTASPEQYHGSAAFYQYYPNLQKVDADCKVYEIPFALSYQFGAKGKRPFFVSAGVSSLIMKEETYTYFYKYNAAGPTVSRTHSTYNANKHFLSIATLSAGYQQKIGKRFMLITEPYVKVPLSGVGNGKVMLNSTGIQFTVGFAPFGKKSSAGTSH